MIKFKTNFEHLLPYDRRHYIDFLDDEFDAETKWSAISLQLNNDNILNNYHNYIEVFSVIFKDIILKLDDGSYWIINHDDKDLKWFNDINNNLVRLRSIFSQNDFKENFIGSLLLYTDDLLFLANDLISYPYLLSYKNLDISHTKHQFIIKITSHMTIDLISMNKEILKEIIRKNISNKIKVVKYRGTII